MEKCIIFLGTLLSCILSTAQIGKVGINTTAPQAMLHVKDSSVVFTGPSSLLATPGNPPVSGMGIRMMWYPDKAAFRTGRVSSNLWDKDSIGGYSVAMGNNTQAKGVSSTAFGELSKAFGNNSFAAGFANESYGQAAVAMGEQNSALGSRSVAAGLGNSAMGGTSVALGNGNVVKGIDAMVIGFKNVNNSLASFVAGQYNDSISTSNPTAWVPTDPLFVIGNGSSATARSNALTVLKNAKTGINTSTPLAMLHVKDSSALFESAAILPAAPGLPPVSGAGNRMMWYADKAALRAGGVSSTQWDKDSVGTYSVALGNNTKARGTVATALGSSTVAAGVSSVAMGDFSQATGTDAIATGFNTRATGNAAISAGTLTTAGGDNALALGSSSRAKGDNTIAAGDATIANAFASITIGRNNDTIAGSNLMNWVNTDPVFTVGNGTTFTNRSNAFIITKEGKTGINVKNGLPTAMLHIKDSSVLFEGLATLPATPGNPPVSGAGTRLMWYPDKAAFRAGTVTGEEWDKNNVGIYSTAFGYDNKAIADNSFATGEANTLLGYGTFAAGSSNVVNNFYSAAYGLFNRTEGFASMALGQNTIARPAFSFAMGKYNDTLVAGNILTGNPTDPVFTIGNGISHGSRSNAFVVTREGKTGINVANELPGAMLHVIKGDNSGGIFNANTLAAFESNGDAFVQFSVPNSSAAGLYAGNTVTSIRSGLIFNADSSISVKTGGITDRLLISKNGNTSITGELNRPSTAVANLVPIAYGSVSLAGAINSGTDNFTVVKSGTGSYEITISGETYNNTGYTAVVTAVGGLNPRMISSGAGGGDLQIRIFNASATLTDTAFHFVVYKE
jgi:hypothetical protein